MRPNTNSLKSKMLISRLRTLCALQGDRWRVRHDRGHDYATIIYTEERHPGNFYSRSADVKLTAGYDVWMATIEKMKLG